MIDGIKKLYIEPCSACNLNCKMCFRNNWIDEQSAIMPRSVFSAVAEELRASKTIDSVFFGGMGEPLLHTEIADMVKTAAELNINTQLLTNGTLLNKNKSLELLRAGLDVLWVSIDSFGKGYENIRIGSELDLILKNISDFNRIRKECKLGITFVVMKDNIDELKRINYFADRLGADYINISHVIPCAPLKKSDCVYHEEIPVGIMKSDGEPCKTTSKANFCPFIGDNCCFVKWSGEICPCMQLLHSSYTYLYEEKRKVMACSFGNIAKTSLEKIWNSKKYSEFRRRVHNFEFPDCTLCDGCDDRMENNTDCMFNEFPTCGACLWAQGIGRCP